MLFRAHGVVGYHARLAFISVETELKFMREVLGSIPNVSIFVRFASVAFIPFSLSFVYFLFKFTDSRYYKEELHVSF